MTRRSGRFTSFWLWSANGERVARFDARRDADAPPAFFIHGGHRYERMPRQSMTARAIHYQTRAIVFRPVPQLTFLSVTG